MMKNSRPDRSLFGQHRPGVGVRRCHEQGELAPLSGRDIGEEGHAGQRVRVCGSVERVVHDWLLSIWVDLLPGRYEERPAP